jgi:hypothetical protein
MSVSTRDLTITANLRLITEECFKCGVTFGMPETLRNTCLDDHSRSFYCPNGHGQVYTGQTDAQKQKARADRLSAQLQVRDNQLVHERDQRRATERSNRALKAVNTRTKKRIANGVCPCCKRNFKDLAQHMSGQHPGYVAEANA